LGRFTGEREGCSGYYEHYKQADDSIASVHRSLVFRWIKAIDLNEQLKSVATRTVEISQATDNAMSGESKGNDKLQMTDGKLQNCRQREG
jgi:hypothetical protein